MSLNTPCNFCDELAAAEHELGLSFYSTDRVLAMPTVGCFARGYTLLVPRSHVASLASLTPADLVHFEAAIQRLRYVLERLFGPVILAEHGSGAPDEPTAACCVHAHLHFIPIKEAHDLVHAAYRERGGGGVLIDSLADLKERELEGHSYLLLSEGSGWRLWVDASRFPRQFVRRAAAAALGFPEYFDWRAHHFSNYMRQTRDLIDALYDRSLNPRPR